MYSATCASWTYLHQRTLHNQQVFLNPHHSLKVSVIRYKPGMGPRWASKIWWDQHSQKWHITWRTCSLYRACPAVMRFWTQLKMFTYRAGHTQQHKLMKCQELFVEWSPQSLWSRTCVSVWKNDNICKYNLFILTFLLC